MILKIFSTKPKRQKTQSFSESLYGTEEIKHWKNGNVSMEIIKEDQSFSEGLYGTDNDKTETSARTLRLSKKINKFKVP